MYAPATPRRSPIPGRVVTDLADGIARHLPSATGPWTTDIGRLHGRAAASITDGRRTVLLAETPGSDPYAPDTVQMWATAHPTDQPHAKTADVYLEARTAIDPRAAAAHIARTVLDATARRIGDDLPMHQWGQRRVETGHTLLNALGPDQQRASYTIDPGHCGIVWPLPHGGTAHVELGIVPDRVHLTLTAAPLPTAMRMLAPLLPKPAAVPRPRTRLPEEWRTQGRAARRLSTAYDLTPAWTDTRTGRGDDSNFYTVQLTHHGAPDVTVTLPAGAPGRDTTPVTVTATCGLDTALLAITNLR